LKGGKIGGKKRAERMTPEQRSEAARKAVLARWAKLTSEQRRKVGRMMVEARRRKREKPPD
jgi:hypothetical protein